MRMPMDAMVTRRLARREATIMRLRMGPCSSTKKREHAVMGTVRFYDPR